MALEMAQQLLSIDREVAFLGMLDTFFPRALHGELPGWKMIFSAHFIRNLPFWLYYFLPLWIRHYCGMAKGWRQSRNQGNSNYGMREIIQWIRNYLPKKYPGRIILYQARAQGLFEVEQKKQWGKVCDSLRICIVPGNHLSILQKPNARFLAEKINLELDRVFTEGIPRRLPKT